MGTSNLEFSGAGFVEEVRASADDDLMDVPLSIAKRNSEIGELFRLIKSGSRISQM